MLNVSIVLYNTDTEQVENLLKVLGVSPIIKTIFLIDNSEKECLPPQLRRNSKITYWFTKSNLGYGKGHNLALKKSLEEHTDYHLVLNSDIEIKATDLEELVAYMDSHPQVGMLMPRVEYPNGDLQYLCKRLPTPFDLFGRRFLPKRWIKKRMEWFEMRDTDYNHIMNVPYLSGCFMLLRTDALQKVGLFDERFFMYPEDIDLTRRIHRDFKTIYYPNITIVHNHAKASYHSLKMLWIHCINICRYFNKWGWFRDKERDRFNQETLISNSAIDK